MKLHSLGSVVKLKAGEEALLIGFFPIDLDTKKQYRYLGIAYPQGINSNQKAILIDEEDIEKVLSNGYEDESIAEYNDMLNTLIGDTEILQMIDENSNSF